MVHIETRYVPARRGGEPRLAYDEAGEGEAVVFLHGIGGNRTNWREQLEAVAGAGWRGVAWDARGYGLSEDYEGPLAFEDFALDLRRLLDHLGVDAAHLVGLSMGGRILLDAWPRFPERFRSLVLCDTFAGYDESFTTEARAKFVAMRRQPLLEGKTPREMAPPVADSLLGPNATLEQRERLIESMAALHPESYIKTVEATVWYDRVAVLPEIGVPCLLIYGEADRLTPPAIGERMAAAIPDARLEVIPGVGHLTNIEAPATFNRLLLDFLDAQGRRSPP